MNSIENQKHVLDEMKSVYVIPLNGKHSDIWFRGNIIGSVSVDDNRNQEWRIRILSKNQTPFITWCHDYDSACLEVHRKLKILGYVEQLPPIECATANTLHDRISASIELPNIVRHLDCTDKFSGSRMAINDSAAPSQ